MAIGQGGKIATKPMFDGGQLFAFSIERRYVKIADLNGIGAGGRRGILSVRAFKGGEDDSFFGQRHGILLRLDGFLSDELILPPQNTFAELNEASFDKIRSTVGVVLLFFDERNQSRARFEHMSQLSQRAGVARLLMRRLIALQNGKAHSDCL